MSSKDRLSNIWQTHRNPDGSEGGLVSGAATIGENVLLDKSAIVTPGSVVPDQTVVEAGQIVSPYGTFRFQP